MGNTEPSLRKGAQEGVEVSPEIMDISALASQAGMQDMTRASGKPEEVPERCRDDNKTDERGCS